MENFYLVYPLLFGEFFAKAKGLKILNYHFFYDEKEKKYFWIYEANYILLPNEKNLFFKVPFVSDYVTTLVLDSVSDSGKFVQCVSEEKIFELKEVMCAELEILSVNEQESTIVASGSRRDAFCVDGIFFLLVNLRNKLYVNTLNDKDLQVELFLTHSDFF